MKNKFAIIALFFAFGTSVAFAHKGATGIVKIRMDAMSAIGKNMKQIGAMLTGKETFNGKVVSKSAAEIADHAANFPTHFKELKVDKFTEAAPAIWQNPNEFKKQSDDLAKFANQLSNKASVTNDPKSLLADFKAVGGTCKSCHEQFRIKK